jgi:hypothetical protein
MTEAINSHENTPNSETNSIFHKLHIYSTVNNLKKFEIKINYYYYCLLKG